MVEVTFKHYGYSGSLTVSDPLNVSKVQEYIALAKREELLALVLSFLVNPLSNRASKQGVVKLADLHKISEVIVHLSGGIRFRVV